MTSPRGSMILRRNVLCVFTTGPCPDQLLPPCVSYSSGHGPVVDPSDTIAMMGGEEGEGGAKTFFMIYMCMCILCAQEMCLEILRDNMTKR